MLMSLRADFLFWVDDQISVKSHFWGDLRWLMWLPLWPFFGIAAVWFENEPVRQVSLGLGLFLCVPWTIFLLRRRRLKKQSWVEPTRFSDENGGY
jgi:hypothetical protein